MNHPGENILKLKSDLPDNVKLIAVSKTVSIEDILQVYNTGHNIFGENKVQELTSKQPLLPDDIEWHFIGHLQSNKVKLILPFIFMIHSIDSLKLLETINREAKKINKKIKCLLQIHISVEDTKFGFSNDEISNLLDNINLHDFQNIEICGLMGMASYTDDDTVVHSEFKSLRLIYEQLKRKYFVNYHSFKEISTGMSGDYRIALNEGSTMIRVGSLIFGERGY